ncbi:MAG: TolC family protein [Emcibacteraceae bacterium]
MIRTFIIMVLATLTIEGPVLAQNTSQPIYIEQAVKRAQQNDPWIEGNRHMEDATKSMSVAAGSLPDPQISLGLSNVPTNNFSLNQDGMTQIRIGVSQMFPQGNSLNIKREQLKLEAHAFPYQRQDRKAQVKVTVSGLWIEAYRAQKSIELIEKNRSLFEQLSEIAMSSYSAAMGKTRQQDIVRAQLELTRLNDRVTMLNQSKDTYIEKLSEWLSAENDSFSTVMIADQMPEIPLLAPEYTDDAVMINDEEFLNRLSDHPLMKALENKIDATAMGVDLARQKYKPSWGLNATYGHRSSDPFGNSRPDNITVGVSLSVPLFTANRQDKEYSSAISIREAVRTEKWQLLRKLKAGFEASKAKLIRLDERKALFENKLLPQMNEQAEASLTAYTNDDGDFAEVVRARIAELNAEIDALNIDVDRQKTILELNYYFTTADTDSLTDNADFGEPK